MYETEKNELIKRATAKGNIYPSGSKTTLDECITVEIIKGKTWILLWTNDKDGSTHLEKCV